MEKDVLQLIAEACAGYSKRQMAIAKYVSENSEIVAFMTSKMLSEAAGVSESSVVRFARQLGFDGYSELRRALQQLIKERIAARGKAAETDSRELAKLAAAEAQNLQALSTPQNERALEQASLLLNGAERIVVQAGLGLEGLDFYLSSGLNALGFPVCAVEKDVSREILNLDDRAVLVSISGHFYSGLLGPVKYARARNAGVVALAESEAAPVRPYADAMLVGNGPAAAATLVMALITALEKDSGKSREDGLAELDALRGEYHTYELTEN